jgi:hypothetical protein
LAENRKRRKKRVKREEEGGKERKKGEEVRYERLGWCDGIVGWDAHGVVIYC